MFVMQCSNCLLYSLVHILDTLQVVYPPWVARILHTLPLVLVISSPLLGSPLDFAHSCLYSARGGAVVLCSVLTATLCPALLGVLRVLALGACPCSDKLPFQPEMNLSQGASLGAGRPMVWYAQHFVAFAMYVPAAAAGALIPYTWGSVQLADALRGVSLLLGILAAVSTSFGLGSGFLPAIWAFCNFLVIIRGQVCFT